LQIYKTDTAGQIVRNNQGQLYRPIRFLQDLYWHQSGCGLWLWLYSTGEN